VSAEEVIRAELGAWTSLDIDQIMTHFAPSAVLDNPSHGPISGYDEIRKTVEGALSRTTHAHMEILNLVAADNVVMTERVDHFVFDGKLVDAPVMGIFEVIGGKIVVWRDYFDTATPQES
jgi:limonene-1,2-epoxide hydrolase